MTDIFQNKYTRRTFIKLIGFSLTTGFIGLWYILSIRHSTLLKRDGFQRVSVQGKPDGTYFYNSFIVIKKGESHTVLSNRCTHAGCKINSEQNGSLVCGCHGSVYNSAGEVVKGPAREALQKLPCTTDPVTGDIIVQQTFVSKV